MNDGHCTLEELRACVRGEDPDAIGRVVDHCRGCEDCGAQLAAMMVLGYQPAPWPIRAFEQAVSFVARGAGRTGPGGVPKMPSQIVISWRVVAVGTAALFLAAWAGFVFNDVWHARGASTSIRQGTDLSALATTESLAPLFVRAQFRGGTPVSGTARPSLVGVAEALVDRQFDRAIDALIPRIEAHPTDSEAAAYLGIAYYLKGEQTALAGELLEMGTTDESSIVARESTWFLANWHLREGDTAAARRLLATLSVSVDNPARRSRELLQSMDSAGH